MSNRHLQAINQFWIRPIGFSAKFERVADLVRLPVEEQLLAAVLRADLERVSSIVRSSQCTAAAMERLENLARVSGLSNLLLLQIIENGMAAEFDAVKLRSNESLLQRLSTLSRAETATLSLTERQFAELLRLLRELKKDLLWIKGIDLRRTVYANPNLRQLGDLDVLVHPRVIDRFLELVEAHGFNMTRKPQSCNQMGAGPIDRLQDLFIAPSRDWAPTSLLTLKKTGWISIDVKIGPLDSGLQAVELDRFFQDSQPRQCLGVEYRGPALSDHLMILLQNLAKDGFSSWKTFYDIHLLAKEANKSPQTWHKFVNSCKIEAISLNAWMGLTLTEDRLHSGIPNYVLDELSPKHMAVSKWTGFTVNSSFVWNTTSLPMLLLNALVSEDRTRKLSLLWLCVFPSKDFLRQYYGRNIGTRWFGGTAVLILHWLVMLLPAGISRRTFGPIIWPNHLKEATSNEHMSLVDIPSGTSAQQRQKQFAVLLRAPETALKSSLKEFAESRR